MQLEIFVENERLLPRGYLQFNIITKAMWVAWDNFVDSLTWSTTKYFRTKYIKYYFGNIYI